VVIISLTHHNLYKFIAELHPQAIPDLSIIYSHQKTTSMYCKHNNLTYFTMF